MGMLRRAARPRRGVVHRRPGAAGQRASPARAEALRDRPGPARPRPRAPLHAADRPGRDGARAGRAGAASSGRRSASRWSTSAATASGSPTPGSPSTRPGCWCCTPPGSSTPGGPLNALSRGLSQIKVAVPNMAQQVIDMAMQLHGGGGMSDDFPLAGGVDRAPGRCGWPTAPTRCTAAWSPGSSSASTDEPRSWSPARASGLGAALTAALRRARRRGAGDRPVGRDVLERRRRRLGGDRQPRRHAPTTTGPRRWRWVEERLGRPRRPGQQRRRRRRRPHRRRRARRVASGSSTINLLGVVRGSARSCRCSSAQRLGPDRQRRLAGRAGAPGRDGVVQRGEGRRSSRSPRPLGHELAAYGVTAHVVCPSYFRTNLMASLRGADDGARRGGDAAGRDARRSPPTTSRRRCWPGIDARRRADPARPDGARGVRR